MRTGKAWGWRILRKVTRDREPGLPRVPLGLACQGVPGKLRGPDSRAEPPQHPSSLALREAAPDPVPDTVVQSEGKTL